MHGGDVWAHRERFGAVRADFSASTNPLGMPSAAAGAARAALRQADRYPDPSCRGLRRAIARFEGVPEKTVLCGNGAADLIWRLCAAVRPRTVLVPAPTFSEYASAARAVGARVRSLSLSAAEGFRLPESFPEALDEEVDLVFLCNPNNPTGRTAPPGLLERTARACRERGVVLAVDECFLGFLPDAERRSLAARAACGRGLVVLKAFTKLFGMAGLRLGYAVTGDALLAEGVRAAGPPWAVSNVAQAAGAAALSDEAFVERTRRLVARERPRLAAALSATGCAVVPSEANYLLFRAPVDDLPSRLARRGVLVRDCRSFEGLDASWCRVAVRGREENDLLAAAVAEALEEGKGGCA